MIKDSNLMWVPWVDPAEATGKVAELYQKVQAGRGGTSAPATALVYSLRPELGMAKDDFRNAVVVDTLPPYDCPPTTVPGPSGTAARQTGTAASAFRTGRSTASAVRPRRRRPSTNGAMLAALPLAPCPRNRCSGRLATTARAAGAG